MKFERSSGIILHPTSLPGPYGIGDLGPAAFQWIDHLAESGCRLWQILPLGPTGYGDSPYQCFSAFAGNPYLISPELMLEDGLLETGDLADKPDFPIRRVDYGWVINWKLTVLDRAYTRFEHSVMPGLRAELDQFRASQSNWLDDFALFMALKEAHQGAPWPTWEPSLRDRTPESLAEARRAHSDAIQKQIFRQFLFFRQWASLRAYVNDKNLLIIGDTPIFAAHDSADVWANPGLFYLDKSGQPTVVAGVPPDYYSPTGQLWGNPLYRWDVHAASGYAWWLDRVRSVLSLVDIIRLDHFRGFAGYWEVPGDEKTAEHGRWVPGPRAHFFQALSAALGDLPIIAEDLGEITPDVIELRDQFDLPGMKILQFAFWTDSSEDPFLPHNYSRNCVVYTGTHDNDTMRGWYERVPEVERARYRRYFDRDGHNVAWDMIRAGWSSVAVFALAPLQDFLELGNVARMNYPGNPSGNWSWRMPSESMSDDLIERIKELNRLYSRKNTPPKDPAKPEK